MKLPIRTRNIMNPNKLKYAPLIVTYTGESLALPLWTIVSIKASGEGCNIETAYEGHTDSWTVDESFDVVIQRYLELIRNA
jgi:hypothetical protein